MKIDRWGSIEQRASDFQAKREVTHLIGRRSGRASAGDATLGETAVAEQVRARDGTRRRGTGDRLREVYQRWREGLETIGAAVRGSSGGGDVICEAKVSLF